MTAAAFIQDIRPAPQGRGRRTKEASAQRSRDLLSFAAVVLLNEGITKVSFDDLLARLRDDLDVSVGQDVTEAQLRTALASHFAFSEIEGGRYAIS